MENSGLVILKSQKIEENRNYLSSVLGPLGQEVEVNEKRSIIIYRNVTENNKSEKSELHENFTDLFFILEGKEELLIGGEIVNKCESKPGEWLGDGLNGAKKYEVEAGDIVIIPKSVAHQHGLGVLKMLVIKIA